MLKKTIFSMAMIGAVALALASSGGGDKKKSSVPATGVNTIKTTPGFSLKAGRSYSNSLSVKTSNNNFALNNTVVTYRKGNTIYILPSGSNRYNKQQVNTRNNLNMLNLKLKLRK